MGGIDITIHTDCGAASRFAQLILKLGRPMVITSVGSGPSVGSGLYVGSGSSSSVDVYVGYGEVVGVG